MLARIEPYWGAIVTTLDVGSGTEGFILRDLVAEPDSELLEQVYRRVLAPAFDPNEVESLEEIQLQVEDGKILRMLAEFDAGGEPVAVITSDWYARARVLLIGYLAVREDLRGQGLGTDLIYKALLKWITDLQPALGVAEVEDPRYNAASDFGDPVARLRLYDRLGARIIGVPYFQPRLGAESHRVHHLMLMAFAVNGEVITDDSPQSVPTAPIGQFLKDYFAAAEGVVPTDAEFLELKNAVLNLPEAPLLHADELHRLPTVKETE
jgi:GNAT superfamily N-acetyltransferase